MDEPSVTPGAETIGRLLAATIGLAVPQPFGFFGAALIEGKVTELAANALKELADVKLRQAAWTLDTAAEALGVDPEQVLALGTGTADNQQLLNDVLMQSASTFNRSKIKALARALANGLRDDGAKVDEELLLVSALAEMDTAHIRQLAMIIDYERKVGTELEHRPRKDDNPVLLEVLRRNGLVFADESDRDRQLQVEVNKAREGAARSAALDGWTRSRPRHTTIRYRTVWRSTPFGRKCLAYLEDQDPDDLQEDS